MKRSNPSAEKVWLVIPAFNEATVIKDVIDSVLSRGYPVVVVDDCSRDDTSEVVRTTGAHLCRHPINLGQGAALQTGIDYALKQGASIVVTFDADGQHDPADIEELIAPIRTGSVEVSLGSRFLSQAAAENIPLVRVLLLKGAVLFTRLTTGLRLTDTHNGFRAFSRKAARSIRITQNRMAHASELLSRLAETRLPYAEVPVHLRYTEYSLSKGQKITNSLNIVWESLTGGLRR
jgi:polyprenyl-phospho-N-acetylgalactosaminyl synthase